MPVFKKIKPYLKLIIINMFMLRLHLSIIRVFNFIFKCYFRPIRMYSTSLEAGGKHNSNIYSIWITWIRNTLVLEIYKNVKCVSYKRIDVVDYEFERLCETFFGGISLMWKYSFITLGETRHAACKSRGLVTDGHPLVTIQEQKQGSLDWIISLN